MPFTSSQLAALLSQGAQSAAHDTQQQQAGEQEEKMARLKAFLAPQVAGQEEAAKLSAARDILQPMQEQFGKTHPGGSYSLAAGPLHVSQAEKMVKPLLTPAQETAEKQAGKKIADYESGGRQALEAGASQVGSVAKELSEGERDIWDRTVGGLTEGHPTLQGFFAPTEKARRDRVQNAALSMLHDAGIPRPTQWDIQRVFGQVYDPSSSDEVNIARLQTMLEKSKAQQQAHEAQSAQYRKTGYATMGSPQTPGQAPSPQMQQQAPRRPVPPPGMTKEQFKQWKASQRGS